MVAESNIYESSDQEILQVVCFELSGEEYAIDVLDVQEVIHLQEITRISQMPEFVSGVINIRGTILPVFDLRVKFNLENREFNPDTRILIVRIMEENLGFIVDKVLETLRIDRKTIEAVPPVKMFIDRECILGIGKFTSRMIILIDIKKLHNFIVDEIKNKSNTGLDIGV